MQKVDTYEFDIFKLRKSTHDHELEVLVPFVLVRHNLIGSNKIDFIKLINFTRALAMGYKRISYHN